MFCMSQTITSGIRTGDSEQWVYIFPLANILEDFVYNDFLSDGFRFASFHVHLMFRFVWKNVTKNT